MTEEVILVDEQDAEIGSMEKLEAHRTGALHRAFSVFIFRSDGKMLLQKRAAHKYHSPNLWTNACCSHPRPGESNKDAAVRRVKEELGMIVSPFESFTHLYKADMGNGLTEHELDHVFLAVSDEKPSPNPEEVSETLYLEDVEIRKQIEHYPEQYTYWFKALYQKVMNEVNAV